MSQLTIAGAAVMHASMKALPKRKGNVLQVGKHGTSAASMKALPKRKGNP